VGGRVAFNIFRGWISRRREREAERDTDGLTLEEAIPDAKLLIAFASAYTRKTEQALIADLVHATGKVIDLAAQKLPVTAEVEAEFWQKYQNLSEELLPVTAASIRASSSAWSWGPSITTHAVAAVVLLMVFGVVLATWATGSTIRADVKLASKDLQDKMKSYTEARAKAALLRSQLDGYEEELNPSSAALKVVQVALPATRITELRKNLSDRTDELRKLTSDLGPIQSEMRSINLRRDPLIDLLGGWYETITPESWRIRSKDRIQLAIDEHEKQLLSAPAQQPGARRIAASNPQFDEVLRRNRVQDAKDSYALDLLHRVDLILEVLQRYLLPLLLGLLGSLTFILRTQIAQVKDQTFHRPYWSLSIARLGLGLIAGLMGGLVITTDDTVLKTLPPLALPFVLGYAIEVLFAFMDKLVKAFVGNDKVPQGA
jgi:hypothetical protein